MISPEQLRRDWFMTLGNNFCWWCGATRCLEVHHMVYRSNAPGRYESPSNYFLCCHGCHQKIHQLPGGILGRLPIVLAYKRHYDFFLYNLDVIREMLDTGRSPTIVTEEDVAEVNVKEVTRFPIPKPHTWKY